eukprot:360488-Chlamydomonas_euryale.AAC.16
MQVSLPGTRLGFRVRAAGWREPCRHWLVQRSTPTQHFRVEQLGAQLSVGSLRRLTSDPVSTGPLLSEQSRQAAAAREPRWAVQQRACAPAALQCAVVLTCRAGVVWHDPHMQGWCGVTHTCRAGVV